MRTSILPEGAELTGEIRGTGDLVVRGVVVGTIDLDGTLTVEAGARVEGEVRARAMVVRGHVEGPVTVLELLRLDAGAQVLGDVTADRVSAALGSLLRGRVRMTGAERLKRTTGGTLTAPFTSSGSIGAPSIDGAEPRAKPMSFEVFPDAGLMGIRERLTELPDDVPERALRRDLATEPSEAVRRVPVPPTPRTPTAPRIAVTLPAPSEAEVAEPIGAASGGPSAPAAPVAPARALPVVPRLQRVRSKERPS